MASQTQASPKKSVRTLSRSEKGSSSQNPSHKNKKKREASSQRTSDTSLSPATEPHEIVPEPQLEERVPPPSRFFSQPLALGITLCGALVFFRLIAEIPAFLEVRETSLQYIAILSPVFGLIMFCLGGLPLLRQGWIDIRSRVISAEFFLSLAMILALGSTGWGMIFRFREFLDQPFVDGLPFFFLLTSTFHWYTNQLHRSISQFQGFFPQLFGRKSSFSTYRVIERKNSRSEAFERVTPESLALGEIVRGRQGQVLFVDGVILSGSAEVALRRFGGAAGIKHLQRGHEIYAGSRIHSGSIEYKVTNLAVDAEILSSIEVLQRTLDEPVSRDYQDYALQKGWGVGLLCGSLFAALLSFALWKDPFIALRTSISVLCLVFVPMTIGFFFPVRRMALSGLYQIGALLNKAETFIRLGKVRNLVIDYPVPPTDADIEILSFDVFDQRIDESLLLQTLLTLFSLSDRELYDRLGSALRSFAPNHTYRDISQTTLDSIQVYEDDGLSAEIGGIDLTFGTERLLIDRGVHFHTEDTDIGAELNRQDSKRQLQAALLDEGYQPVALFLSMGTEVVARILTLRRPFLATPTLVSDLRSQGVRAVLISDADAQLVDDFGKIIGLELADISGGITPQQYPEKVKTFEPAAFYSERFLKRTLSAVTMSRFSTLVQETSISDVVLYRDDARAFPALFSLIRREEVLRKRLTWLAIISTSLFYALSLSQFASPVLVLLGVTGILTVSSVLLYLFGRSMVETLQKE